MIETMDSVGKVVGLVSVHGAVPVPDAVPVPNEQETDDITIR